MRLRTFGGLWIEPDGTQPIGKIRPRPLALLAVLSTAGAKGLSREIVLGVLWPESAPDLARHALSQTLYTLRRDLGDEVVISSQNLALDARKISSDAADFSNAVRDARWNDATALYVGPFLHGFYLGDAAEFERWAETERASLAEAAKRAFEALAKQCGDRPAEAAPQWRRLVQLDPLSPRYSHSYMEALAASGDRTGALAHGRAYAELVERELDAPADPAIHRLMAHLRDGDDMPVAIAPSPPVAASVAETPDSPPLLARPAAQRPSRRRGRILAVVGALGLAAAIGWRATVVSPERPVLAVARIRDFTPPLPGVVPGAGVTNEILATSLGRVAELRVIAGSRMLELIARGEETSRTAVTEAAHLAGATEMIEGELMPLSDGRFRLNVRRVNVARGIIRAAYEISGSDRIALFDSATTLITAGLGIRAPSGSLTDVSTRSPVAFRLYEEALRSLDARDYPAADRFIRLAIKEDSTFAMALYYAWRIARDLHASDERALSDRAMAAAAHASERDRLVIQSHISYARNDIRALAQADTLATKYPDDPEALLRAAEFLPDLGRAISLANRAIALDSAASVPTGAPCHACRGLKMIAYRYRWADSSAAVERTARRWTALRPLDPVPWTDLEDLMISLGRRREARVAAERAAALDQTGRNTDEQILTTDIRFDDVSAADTMCATGLRAAARATFDMYRWNCTIVLRMEGRYEDAIALARDGIVSGVPGRRNVPADGLVAALVNMEAGRGSIAADQFVAAAREAERSGEPATARARDVAWRLTLAATAAVAGGDTIRARRLADSIESIGRSSLYPRDPLLHHFVRGIVHASAHRDALAAGELRASMFSPTLGYTRANYELARTLSALRRPAEGIPVVQAALRGGIEGSGLYVTRTALHELLAQLFDAAGQRDSALVHYAIVERAWRSADPFLRPRYEAARRRLAESALVR